MGKELVRARGACNATGNLENRRASAATISSNREQSRLALIAVAGPCVAVNDPACSGNRKRTVMPTRPTAAMKMFLRVNIAFRAGAEIDLVGCSPSGSGCRKIKPIRCHGPKLWMVALQTSPWHPSPLLTNAVPFRPPEWQLRLQETDTTKLARRGIYLSRDRRIELVKICGGPQEFCQFGFPISTQEVSVPCAK